MASEKSGNMIRNALTMMIGTFSSRVLGLLREVITAASFGAGRSLDAFFVAYTVANLGRQLLAEGRFWSGTGIAAPSVWPVRR